MNHFALKNREFIYSYLRAYRGQSW